MRPVNWRVFLVQRVVVFKLGRTDIADRRVKAFLQELDFEYPTP